MIFPHFLKDRDRSVKIPSFRLAVTLGLLILAIIGSGCSFGIPLPTGSENQVGPSSATPTSSLPEPSATVPTLPPEPWGEVQRTFSFEYQCQPYAVTVPLYQSTYEYFQDLDRYYYYQGELPENWPAPFYLNFLSSSEDLEPIRDLINEVRTAIGQEGDDLAIALISLVQNLTYDCDKLFSYVELEGEGFQTNFPYETLYTSIGVCGDTSILLGKILRELGYGTAFLLYDGSNHMALGIRCPLEVATYVEGQTGYCYIETTGPARIGVKPGQLGGMDFVEEPMVIQIGEGASFERMISLAEEMELDTIRYGGRMLEMATCQEIQLYQEIVVRRAAMQSFDSQLIDLKSRVEGAIRSYEEEVELFQSMGCEGTLPPKQYELCVAQQAVLKEAYEAYERSVAEYYQVVETSNSELDRLNEAINNFNYLMGVNNQDCGLIFSEPIEVDGEGEE